jgi:hypothetical protein
VLGVPDPGDLFAGPFVDQHQLVGDKVYFSLTIDPVNPDAVNRRKRDPELCDLYVFDPATTTTTRLARLAVAGRKLLWRVSDDGKRWAVLRRHKVYPRGGAELEVYQLTK